MQYQLPNGLILAFKQCKVFSVQLHISFRNALLLVPKLLNISFKITQDCLLNYLR
mgnify:CR=1 FL=1